MIPCPFLLRRDEGHFSGLECWNRQVGFRYISQEATSSYVELYGKKIYSKMKSPLSRRDGGEMVSIYITQRHVEYLVATACPDAPRYVSIEYWWSFVPFFAVVPSVLWRRCSTYDEWSDVISLRCLLYTRSHVVIVRVARRKQFDAMLRRKFDDYTTINVATSRWLIDSVSELCNRLITQ